MTATFARLIAPAALVAAVVAALIAWPTADAQTGSRSAIHGRVVNGTAGASVPSGLQVVLLYIDETQQTIVNTDTATTDAEGRFSFEDLPAATGLVYRVAANAGDYTPSVDLRAEDDWSNVEVTIHEETHSFEGIGLASYAMLVPSIDPASRTMGVLTVARVTNRGDHVWVPDLDKEPLTGLDLLRFNLPEGFEELSVESDLPPGNVMEIGTGFALTNPVPPGEYDILVSYLVTYEGSSLAFPLRLPYGADDVRVMLPVGQGEITGMGLGAGEPVVVGDSQYLLSRGFNYGPDSQLDVSLSSLPEPNVLQAVASFFNDQSYMMVIVWVVAAAMLVLLAYAVYVTRRARAAQAAAALPADGPVLTREEAVQQIAALDEEHERGLIGDDEHARRRQELTRQALHEAEGAAKAEAAAPES